jgi:hypothetical protein
MFFLLFRKIDSFALLLWGDYLPCTAEMFALGSTLFVVADIGTVERLDKFGFVMEDALERVLDFERLFSGIFSCSALMTP